MDDRACFVMLARSFDHGIFFYAMKVLPYLNSFHLLPKVIRYIKEETECFPSRIG